MRISDWSSDVCSSDLPYLIARTLVGDAPYFISHGSALELHRMVTQPQLVIIVSCAKRLRPQHIHGYGFRFVDVKPQDFFGVTEIWITSQEQVRVRDPERKIGRASCRERVCQYVES